MLHTDGDIAALGVAFLDRSLPKARWTHEGHFAATLWLLRTRPEIDLPRAMPALIRAFNEAKGGVNTATEGYHETITQASIRAARAFTFECQAMDLAGTLAALMASPLGKPGWLFAYWSPEVVFSAEARAVWVEPDLRPLPF